MRKQTKSKKISIRDLISEQYEDTPLLFMEGDFDYAIVGVCEGISIQHMPKVAYDYDKVIEVNMSMGMSREEAIEYFDYNQGSAYVGEHTPVFIRTLTSIEGGTL